MTDLSIFQALRSLAIEVQYPGSDDIYAVWKAVLMAISSLNPHATLEFVAVRVVSESTVSGVPLVEMRWLAKLVPAHAVEVDAALAAMVTEGRLRRVCTGLYSQPGDYGPRHLFRQDAPDFLRSIFPRVNALGALHLFDLFDDAAE